MPASDVVKNSQKLEWLKKLDITKICPNTMFSTTLDNPRTFLAKKEILTHKSFVIGYHSNKKTLIDITTE